MTIPQLQVIIYTCIVSKLMGVVDEFGEGVDSQLGELRGKVDFRVGYQVRPNFNHNYQREKYLSKRDKYIFAKMGLGRLHLLTERNKNEVVLYSKPIQEVFGKDTGKAVKLMSKMLHRMYDRVYVEETSGITLFDQSNNRHEEHNSFYEV